MTATSTVLSSDTTLSMWMSQELLEYPNGRSLMAEKIEIHKISHQYTRQQFLCLPA